MYAPIAPSPQLKGPVGLVPDFDDVVKKVTLKDKNCLTGPAFRLDRAAHNRRGQTTADIAFRVVAHAPRGGIVSRLLNVLDSRF